MPITLVAALNYFPKFYHSSLSKVHIFSVGHKILQNLHRRFDCYCRGQIYGGDFSLNFVVISEYMNFS